MSDFPDVPSDSPYGVPIFPVTQQLPTPGRIVLFHDRITGQTSPAIVTMADPNGINSAINLTVFPDMGMPFSYGQVPNINQSGGSMVCWTWPPRAGAGL